MGNCINNQGSYETSGVDLSKGKTLVVPYEEIHKALNAIGIQTVYTQPSNYIIVDKDVFKDYLKGDGTDKFKYVKERTDCDNFTHILLGRIQESVLKKGTHMEGSLAIGEVTGMISKDGGEQVAHSMIIAIVNDNGSLKPYLVEPQNDKWYTPDSNSKFWAAYM